MVTKIRKKKYKTLSDKQILKLIEKYKSVTTAILAKELKVHWYTIQEKLRKLQDKGLVQHRMLNKYHFWSLSKK